ncbi:MAG: hypothetical protein GTO22_14450 [Gemmatimonadales bacterium]|nr:hypothetical protein [Gemmatimonadales bacterium]
MTEWHEKSDLPWAKIHIGWWFSPSHAGLDITTLGLGLFALCLANRWGRREDGSGRLVDKGGNPMTPEDIGRMRGVSSKKSRKTFADLKAVGTLSFDEQGWYFPNLRKWQETPGARRVREWRSRQGDVTSNVTSNDYSNVTGNDSEEQRNRGTEEQKKKKNQKTPPNPPAGGRVALAIEAWNRGVSGTVSRAVAPSARTDARDKRIRKQLGRFPPAWWEHCARALSASEHHQRWGGVSIGWLLERGNGSKLEEWMQRGQDMLAGEWSPQHSDPVVRLLAEARAMKEAGR